jgi:hypothetical protein
MRQKRAQKMTELPTIDHRVIDKEKTEPPTRKLHLMLRSLISCEENVAELSA